MLRKKSILLAVMLISLCGLCVAQSVPPPPKPHIETDLRDNTTKIRAIELERVKREANKSKPGGTNKLSKERFSRTKKHFERIQRLQDLIVRTYTTGEKIDYGRIAELAANMTDSAVWLDNSLFGGANEEKKSSAKHSKQKKDSVRDLIIDLDKAIHEFVTSPIFSDTRTVDTKQSRKAKTKLEALIKLSTSLSKTAKSLQ